MTLPKQRPRLRRGSAAVAQDLAVSNALAAANDGSGAVAAGGEKPIGNLFLLRVSRSLKTPTGAFGATVLGLMIVLAIFASLIAPNDPLAHSATLLAGPSGAHWFGTDEYGRDIFSRVVWGARPALVVSVLAVVIAGLVAVPLGLVSGFRGGFVDTIAMRLCDILLSFPGILSGIALIAIFGNGELVLSTVIAITSMPTLARVTRSVALQTRDRGYVDAARMLGVGTTKILWRHILPNALGPVLVYSVIRMATALLTAAALSYLGLGIQPPTADWGQMLNEGKGLLFETPWLGVFPGIAIAIFVLGLTFLSDALARGFDVRS